MGHWDYYEGPEGTIIGIPPFPTKNQRVLGPFFETPSLGQPVCKRQGNLIEGSKQVILVILVL